MKTINSTTLFLFLFCLLFATDCKKPGESEHICLEEIESGTIGDKLTWSLCEDGTLTISGTGGFGFLYNSPPWTRESITAVVIKDGVIIIGPSAFWECTGLTSVTIPNSVTHIGESAFWGCTGLTSVTIPNSVTSIGRSAFSGCNGLTSITIPNSVISIGIQAFWGCTGLTSVTIPNSVASIGINAFANCSGLTSLTIGSSVKSIGAVAFYTCTGLTEIINKSAAPQEIDVRVFYNVNISSCTLRVPAASIDAYRTAPVWQDFGTIVAI